MRDRLLAFGLGFVQGLTLWADDLGDRRVVIVFAIGCERTESRGHLQGCDLLASERDGQDRVQIARDTHAVCGVHDLLGAHLRREPGERGVH